jgi:hypothetical protein
MGGAALPGNLDQFLSVWTFWGVPLGFFCLFFTIKCSPKDSTKTAHFQQVKKGWIGLWETLYPSEFPPHFQ